MKKPKKMVFEEVLAVESMDDGEQAMVCSVCQSPSEGEDSQAFVRVQSWDEKCIHPRLKEFLGRKVRVTVEVI